MSQSTTVHSTLPPCPSKLATQPRSRPASTACSWVPALSTAPPLAGGACRTSKERALQLQRDGCRASAWRRSLKAVARPPARRPGQSCSHSACSRAASSSSRSWRRRLRSTSAWAKRAPRQVGDDRTPLALGRPRRHGTHPTVKRRRTSPAPERSASASLAKQRPACSRSPASSASRKRSAVTVTRPQCWHVAE